MFTYLSIALIPLWALSVAAEFATLVLPARISTVVVARMLTATAASYTLTLIVWWMIRNGIDLMDWL